MVDVDIVLVFAVPPQLFVVVYIVHQVEGISLRATFFSPINCVF